MKTNSDIQTISNGFLTYLKTHKKNHLLPQIIRTLSQSQNLLGTVLVESSLPLSAIQKKQVSFLVKKQFPSTTSLDFKIDSQILGGLRVSSGDKILDLTLNAKLDSLTSTIN